MCIEKNLAARIAAIREDFELSQDQVARFLKLDTDYYANLEFDASRLTLDDLSSLANLYHVSIGYLLDDIEPITEPLPKYKGGYPVVKVRHITELTDHEKQLVLSFRLLGIECQHKVLEFINNA